MKDDCIGPHLTQYPSRFLSNRPSYPIFCVLVPPLGFDASYFSTSKCLSSLISTLDETERCTFHFHKVHGRKEYRLSSLFPIISSCNQPSLEDGVQVVGGDDVEVVLSETFWSHHVMLQCRVNLLLSRMFLHGTQKTTGFSAEWNAILESMRVAAKPQLFNPFVSGPLIYDQQGIPATTLSVPFFLSYGSVRFAKLTFMT